MRFAVLAILVVALTAGRAYGGQPIYYVLGLGDVAQSDLDFACAALATTFRVRCLVTRARPLPRTALDLNRNQYDADRLVKDLFSELPRDGLGLMVITNGDLFEPGRTRFVFGLASLVDHVGVVSLARFRETWWGEAPDEARYRERFYKVLIHEVGHTLGISHCPNVQCAMRDDRTLADLDNSPERFCSHCRAAIERGLKNQPDTGLWYYMRGHSYLSRGQLPLALYHFERAYELMPEDARVVNDLGVAYLRRGDGGRALWCFREAQRRAPVLGSAVYNEGLVYLGAGDQAAARRAFHHTLRAEPTFSLAHRQLGFLLESAHEPHLALAHFEAYLLSHGSDVDVETRVRQIKGGGR